MGFPGLEVIGPSLRVSSSDFPVRGLFNLVVDSFLDVYDDSYRRYSYDCPMTQ